MPRNPTGFRVSVPKNGKSSGIGRGGLTYDRFCKASTYLGEGKGGRAPKKRPYNQGGGVGRVRSNDVLIEYRPPASDTGNFGREPQQSGW